MRPERDLDEWNRDAWKILSEKVAPNALHDSGARSPPPRCAPGTRVKAITDVMGWIQSSDGPRLLCMTAAAGAGKSALQQTVAERCSDLKILGSAFFFSATDPTRNGLSAIVPTMAFELGQNYPALKRFIAAAVADDHHIFAKSLETQMKALIVAPFERFRESNQSQASRVPYAILIDGLSECDGEDRQAQALEAIKSLLRPTDPANLLPFRIFITSRPESAIFTALYPGGILHDVAAYSDLSDKYDATEDIRLYLRSRLSDIGSSGWRDGLQSQPGTAGRVWPRDEDIEVLVKAASGQFIYAETVIRYVEKTLHRSPHESLHMILTWSLRPRSTSPFKDLDDFYTNILSSAKASYERDYPDRNFLVLLRAYHINDTIHIGRNLPFVSTAILNEILDLEHAAHEWMIANLKSLITLERDRTDPGNSRLRLYHESFSDFLNTQIRSGEYYIPQSRVYAHIADCCFRHISQCPLDSITSFCNEQEEGRNQLTSEGTMVPILPPRPATPSLAEKSCFALPTALIAATDIDGSKIVSFIQGGGWEKVHRFLSIRARSSTVAKSLVGDWMRASSSLRARFENPVNGISIYHTLTEYHDKWRALTFPTATD